MEKLNNLLNELGVSKVRLAKYLGVSRQMIYNYLELDELSVDAVFEYFRGNKNV